MYDNYRELMVDLYLIAKERPLTPREQVWLDKCERMCKVNRSTK